MPANHSVGGLGLFLGGATGRVHPAGCCKYCNNRQKTENKK